MNLEPFIQLRPHIGGQQKFIVHGRQQGYISPERGGVVQWLSRATIGKGALNDDERAWCKLWVRRYYAREKYGDRASLGQCTACGEVGETDAFIWLPIEHGGQRAYCEGCIKKAGGHGKRQSVVAG